MLNSYPINQRFVIYPKGKKQKLSEKLSEQKYSGYYCLCQPPTSLEAKETPKEREMIKLIKEEY